MTVVIYGPLVDQGKGGANFSLVELVNGKPSCVMHGAMNKVSPSPPGYWRCVHSWACRAACQEAPGELAEEAG